jgi:hypothetical protein
MGRVLLDLGGKLGIQATGEFPHYGTDVRNRPFDRQRSVRNLGTVASSLEHPWNKIDHLKGNFGFFPGARATESTRFLERAMGIELLSQILSLGTARRYHRSSSQLVPSGAKLTVNEHRRKHEGRQR